MFDHGLPTYTNWSFNTLVPKVLEPNSLFCGLAVTRQLQASCEIHFFTDSLPNSHTQPLHKIPQKYREIIEQNYNQIWHRINANIKHSCKSQLYNLPLWLFCDKTPKQTLGLKREYENKGKTHSHLNLKFVKHLNHIHLYPKTLAHNK